MWQSTRDLMLFSVPMARLPSTTAHSVLSSRLEVRCWSRYSNLERHTQKKQNIQYGYNCNFSTGEHNHETLQWKWQELQYEQVQSFSHCTGIDRKKKTSCVSFSVTWFENDKCVFRAEGRFYSDVPWHSSKNDKIGLLLVVSNDSILHVTIKPMKKKKKKSAQIRCSSSSSILNVGFTL